MGSAEAIMRSAKIAIDQGAAVVVVSAVSGTTNMLVELKNLAKTKETKNIQSIINQITHRHKTILTELDPQGKDDFIEQAMQKLSENVLKVSSDNHRKIGDEILATGESISTKFMVLALNKLGKPAEFFDSKIVIKTDANYGMATPDIAKIKSEAEKNLVPLLNERVLVTQGFIGSTDDGSTATIGRGGSDYSAALFAEAVSADELQIWTDVGGIATTDPRLVPNARHLDAVTFQEAAELATAGAKILHSRTITPMRRANIPIYVGNSFNPETAGTKISASTDKIPIVRAIVIKKNQSIIRITTTDMAERFGYLANILGVFAKHKINLDQITTSEITVAFGVEDWVLEHKELLDELSQLGEVKIEDNVNAISLIGNNINSTPGLIRDIFTALEESENDRISVRMICQGASKHNICFFVLASEGEKAVKKLHRELIERPKA